MYYEDFWGYPDPWPPTCPEHDCCWPHDDLDYLAWENEFDDND